MVLGFFCCAVCCERSDKKDDIAALQRNSLIFENIYLSLIHLNTYNLFNISSNF